jgi:hypothetical protein
MILGKVLDATNQLSAYREQDISKRTNKIPDVHSVTTCTNVSVNRNMTEQIVEKGRLWLKIINTLYCREGTGAYLFPCPTLQTIIDLCIPKKAWLSLTHKCPLNIFKTELYYSVWNYDNM